MRLSSLFPYGNKKSNSAKQEAVRQVSSDKMDGKKTADLRNVTTGQTLHGEVVAREGNEIQIRTDQDIILTARLERELTIAVGQMMTFEVKSNNGEQVALRPLFENLANDQNMLKALEAARLPASEEMMLMVDAMMKQGMSIDKNALQEMARLINANPGEEPGMVVMLKALHLPITEENLEQLKQYLKLEHQLVDDMSKVTDGLPKTFQKMMAEGNDQGALELYQKLVDEFVLPGTDKHAGSTQQLFPGMLPVEENSGKTEMKHIILSGELQAEAEQAKSVDLLPKDAAFQKTLGEALQTLQESPGRGGAVTVGELLTAGEIKELSSFLEKMGAPHELVIAVREGTTLTPDLLKQIMEFVQTQSHHLPQSEVEALLTGKEFQKMLKNEVMNQWLLSPEDVGGKEKVLEFYKRLGEQSARLAEVANQTAKGTPLARSLTAVQNNVQFMHQLNQVFQYMQLPLKTLKGNAHGDLYVYRRRGKSFSEEEAVTALLHLDMEYLGSLDIHITMKERNVSTKFYLADEGTIDFLASHMSVLDERLKKKGYTMETELIRQRNDQKTNVIGEMAKEENHASVLSHYSFDVRA